MKTEPDWHKKKTWNKNYSDAHATFFKVWIILFSKGKLQWTWGNLKKETMVATLNKDTKQVSSILSQGIFFTITFPFILSLLPFHIKLRHAWDIFSRKLSGGFGRLIKQCVSLDTGNANALIPNSVDLKTTRIRHFILHIKLAWERQWKYAWKRIQQNQTQFA